MTELKNPTCSDGTKPSVRSMLCPLPSALTWCVSLQMKMLWALISFQPRRKGGITVLPCCMALQRMFQSGQSLSGTTTRKA